MSLLEVFANIVTILSVWLAARNRVLTWPIGICGCILYGIMFYGARLYADVILQVFFVATSLKGWWVWKHGGVQHGELPLSRVSGRALLILYLPLSVAVAMAHGAILFSATDASYPFVDSVVLVFSVAAQLLLMRRKVESWIFWIVVDTVAVPLYATKELYLTSVVYAVFLANAFYGYWSWQQEYRLAKPLSVP